MKLFGVRFLEKQKNVGLFALGVCMSLGATWVSNKFRIYPSSSDLAAWVQAVGSILAIGIAVRVVQIQHENSVDHSNEIERKSRRRHLNLLIITLQTTAIVCNEVKDKARNDYIIPELESASLLEARKRLQDIPASSIPDIAVLMKVEMILLKLHKLAFTCKWLHKERPQCVRDGFASALENLGRECFLALHDTGRILAEISSSEEIASDWRMIDLWKENYDSAVQIMQEHGLITKQAADLSNPISSPTPNHSSPSQD